MEVILQQDVDNLGTIGEIIRVKPGYARNYLVPRGLAVVADRKNLAKLEHEKRVVAVKVERARQAAKSVAGQLEKVELEFTMKASSEGKLFGSVTNQDLHKALADRGMDVDRKKIQLPGPIKALGEHAVPVSIGAGVKVEIRVVVKPEEAPEAEAAPEAESPSDEA